MEASASEPECSGDELSRPIFISAKRSWCYVFYRTDHRRPRRTLRTASPCSHLLRDRLQGLSLVEAQSIRGLDPVVRNAGKNLMNLCAMSGCNHFFDERCSGKFIFIVRAK